MGCFRVCTFLNFSKFRKFNIAILLNLKFTFLILPFVYSMWLYKSVTVSMYNGTAIICQQNLFTGIVTAMSKIILSGCVSVGVQDIRLRVTRQLIRADGDWARVSRSLGINHRRMVVLRVEDTLLSCVMSMSWLLNIVRVLATYSHKTLPWERGTSHAVRRTWWHRWHCEHL